VYIFHSAKSLRWRTGTSWCVPAWIRPGFICSLDATTDLEITSFANSITLTPGTISVHPDDRSIVIHAIGWG
jgi:multicomponent Na+:H+ antiporter subunit E